VFSLDESATDYEQNDTLGKVADIDASKTDLERAQRLARLDAEMQRHGLALPEGERVSLKDGNLQASEAQLSEERDSASGQSESASIAPVDFSEAVVEGVTMSEAAQMDRVDEISSVPSASVLPSAAEGAVEITSGSEAAKPEKEKALVAPEKSGAFRSRSWLEAQLSTAYLPQILGSFEERTALKFIAELGKQKFDVYYLETEHKGRPWYVVFYGVFPSKKQAQEAIKVAPERIQRQQPWLRRADTVLKSYPD
jgi:septal ring-binding cell division protein DamX